MFGFEGVWEAVLEGPWPPPWGDRPGKSDLFASLSGSLHSESIWTQFWNPGEVILQALAPNFDTMLLNYLGIIVACPLTASLLHEIVWTPFRNPVDESVQALATRFDIFRHNVVKFSCHRCCISIDCVVAL